MSTRTGLSVPDVRDLEVNKIQNSVYSVTVFEFIFSAAETRFRFTIRFVV